MVSKRPCGLWSPLKVDVLQDVGDAKTEKATVTESDSQMLSWQQRSARCHKARSIPLSLLSFALSRLRILSHIDPRTFKNNNPAQFLSVNYPIGEQSSNSPFDEPMPRCPHI